MTWFIYLIYSNHTFITSPPNVDNTKPNTEHSVTSEDTILSGMARRMAVMRVMLFVMLSPGFNCQPRDRFVEHSYFAPTYDECIKTCGRFEAGCQFAAYNKQKQCTITKVKPGEFRLETLHQRRLKAFTCETVMFSVLIAF